MFEIILIKPQAIHIDRLACGFASFIVGIVFHTQLQDNSLVMEYNELMVLIILLKPLAHYYGNYYQGVIDYYYSLQ